MSTEIYILTDTIKGTSSLKAHDIIPAKLNNELVTSNPPTPFFYFYNPHKLGLGDMALALSDSQKIQFTI